MWKLAITFRILLALLPQYGYIHPDEYFQGPEIAAGDILQCDVYRTWEFNATSPIRSILSIHLGSISFFIFSLVSLFFKLNVHSYWLLIAPRVTMTFISFIQDFCLYKISKKVAIDPKINSFIFATSFTALTFHCRNLSNNLEAVCFTLLIYFVVDSVTFNNPINSKDKIEFKINYTTEIAMVLAIGVFIRPTFVIFALIPIFVWLFQHKFFKTKAFKLQPLITQTIFFCILIIVLDTVYYNGNFNVLLDVFEAKERTFNNLIITPLNFIKYNFNPKNLEQHGLHPFYLHILVNIPLMFGLLGVISLFHIIIVTLTKSIYRINENVNVFELFMYFSWIVPVLGLSIFPHQEPRFLIPLLMPLVILHGQKIYNSKCLMTLWIVSNIFCICFYSFFHQSGLVPCLLEFSETIKESERPIEIIFYHTYMPPRFLLQLPRNQRNVFVKDIGGASIDILEENILHSVKNNEKQETYLVIPGTVSTNNEFIQKQSTLNKIKFDKVKSYFPHFTTEDFPNINKLWKCALSNCDFWRVLKQQLSLEVFKLSLL